MQCVSIVDDLDFKSATLIVKANESHKRLRAAGGNLFNDDDDDAMIDEEMAPNSPRCMMGEECII